jgi:hypothetical protein
MRIYEIITPVEKTKQLKTSWDLDKLRSQRSDAITDYLANPDAGYYGQGYQTKDPFLYGKKYHMPTNLESDPYYQYIKTIKPLMDSNPYVPRVYSVKLYRDQQGYVKPDYNMEKLVKGHEVSKKLIYSMGVKMFGSDNWFEFKKSAKDPLFNYTESDNTYMWRKLADLLNDSVKTWPAYPFKHISFKNYDSNLIDLIKIIKMLIIRIPDTRSDIHSNNIMVRMGSTPQVVITDPIGIDTYKTIIPKKY